MTDKEKRVKKEERRLLKIYKDIEPKRKATVIGLIQRMAYMRITLEDMEKDIDENGFIEMFSQSEKTEPYERQRPVVNFYNTMNTSYQKAIKQLTDLLPKQTDKPKAEDDGFDDFINALDD